MERVYLALIYFRDFCRDFCRVFQERGERWNFLEMLKSRFYLWL